MTETPRGNPPVGNQVFRDDFEKELARYLVADKKYHELTLADVRKLAVFIFGHLKGHELI